MTYKQANEIGGQVRGGEKSTHIVFTKKLTIKDRESEEEKQIGMLKAYSVFNLAQIDGLFQETAVEVSQEQRQDAVTAFVAATKADIRIGGDELGHWTGAKSRLDRDLKSRFNEKSYAAEELVAELTAAFLCAHLNIKGELRHAEYINNWIQLLKEDDRAIFTASSKASQAANFLRAFSGELPESE